MSQFVSTLQSLQSFFLIKRLPPPAGNKEDYLTNSDKELLNNGKENSRQPIVGIKVANQSAELTTFIPVVKYISETTALLFDPVKQYDGKIADLLYGDAVTVAGYQGNYARVQSSQGTGWVEKDSLAKRKEDVWPVWVLGEWYDASHPNTAKVRELIKDEFFAGRAGLSLQSAEFVTVTLLADKRSITWPVMGKRIAGRWHQMLRGTIGIHSVVYPVTDSVMEWTDEDGIGHLAFVRSVRPDKTIRIEGINILENGVYESVLLPEALWREWRPVFIEVG